MKIEPQLRKIDRLVFRGDAKRAGIPADQIRPLHPRWIETDKVARVLVDDLWFETEIDDAWIVAYRIVSQPRGLAVAEVRVFPRAGRTRPGEWIGILQGTRADNVPEGGITRRLLDQVRLDRSVWYGREVLRELAKARGRIKDATHPGRGQLYILHVLDRAGVRPGPPTPDRRTRRGRKRLPPEEYERVAREYTRLLLARKRKGSSFYKALAARLRVSVAQAQNRVVRARKYGFLQGTPLRIRAR